MSSAIYQRALAADRAVTGVVYCSDCRAYVPRESIVRMRPRARCKACDAQRCERLAALAAQPASAASAPSRVATRDPRRGWRA